MKMTEMVKFPLRILGKIMSSMMCPQSYADNVHTKLVDEHATIEGFWPS